MNDVASENERSIPHGEKRDSIHSNWSDLLSVNEEAEYKKIYKDGSELNIIGVAITSAETVKKSSVPPVNKTIKT